MNLKQVLDKLNDTGSDVTFYECGSRAVAKRIGTDKLTQEQIDAAFKKWICDPSGGGLKDDPKQPYYWAVDAKPILITESTDYDFFCQHTPKHVAYLESLGFVATWYSAEAKQADPDNVFAAVKQSDDYRDDLCEGVYEHEDYNIQVVLRSDALLYKTIFENIPYQIYHDFLWKSSPVKPDRSAIRRWFDTFANIAKAVRELN